MKMTENDLFFLKFYTILLTIKHVFEIPKSEILTPPPLPLPEWQNVWGGVFTMGGGFLPWILL